MPTLSPYRGSYAPLQQMDRDHGVPLFDKAANLFRFQTGALRRPTFGDPSHTLCSAPPTDERECQELKVAFWKLYSSQAADEFVDMKNILVNSAEAIGARFSEAEEELKGLQKIVRKGRRKLKEAENELLRLELGAATVEDALRLKEERARRAGESYHDQEAQRNSKRGKLQSISIRGER